MANPIKPGKQTVQLDPTESSARVSRIRRDPPPQAIKPPVSSERRERESRMVAIGIVSFAIALAIIIVGFSDALS
jgi:hypothetical protein